MNHLRLLPALAGVCITMLCQKAEAVNFTSDYTTDPGYSYFTSNPSFITIAGGQLNYSSVTGSAAPNHPEWAEYSIGPIKNSRWTMQFKLNVHAVDIDAIAVVSGLSSNPSELGFVGPPVNYQNVDGIWVQVKEINGNYYLQAAAQDENSPPVFSGLVRILLNTDYCVLLERFQGSEVKLSVFTDVECNFHADNSPQCLMIPGIIENLELLVHRNAYSSGTGIVDFHIDNMEIEDISSYVPTLTVSPGGPYTYCVNDAPFYLSASTNGSWLPPLPANGYFDPAIYSGTQTFTFVEGNNPGPGCSRQVSITMNEIALPAFSYTTSPAGPPWPNIKYDPLNYHWPVDITPAGLTVDHYKWSFGTGAQIMTFIPCVQTVTTQMNPVVAGYDGNCVVPRIYYDMKGPQVCLEIWFNAPAGCDYYKYCSFPYDQSNPPSGKRDIARSIPLIYPNPSSDHIVIQGIPARANSLELLNMSGIVAYQKEGPLLHTETLDISDYPAGMYRSTSHNYNIPLHHFLLHLYLQQNHS